ERLSPPLPLEEESPRSPPASAEVETGKPSLAPVSNRFPDEQAHRGETPILRQDPTIQGEDGVFRRDKQHPPKVLPAVAHHQDFRLIRELGQNIAVKNCAVERGPQIPHVPAHHLSEDLHHVMAPDNRKI